MKTILVVVSLINVVFLCGSCAKSEDLDALREKLQSVERRLPVQSDAQLARRVAALEERLKELGTEVRTKRLVAEGAVFQGANYVGDKIDITPHRIMISSGNVENRAGSGTVAMYASDELYIEDSVAHHSADSDGKSIRLSLSRSGLDSPEVSMWHYNDARGRLLDRKMSTAVQARTEVVLDASSIGKSEGFWFIDSEYGPLIIRANELKSIGSEVVLSIQVATASSVPLTGLKGKVRFRAKSPNRESASGRSRSFVLERRMESGVFHSLSIPLEVAREQLGGFITLCDVEVLGAFLRK